MEGKLQRAQGWETYGGQQSDGAASRDGRGRGVKRQLGEGLDRQRGVALRARGDELRGQGVDLVVGQGRVKGLGEGSRLEPVADVGVVASLDGEDAAGRSEVRLAHDVGGGAEVGRDANALKDGRSGEEGLHIVVAKVVRAGLDGGHIGSY